jgi:hypothetical protein
VPTDGERLAILEEQIRDLHGDMRELTSEIRGLRTRTHNLEGTTATFAGIQQANREAEARQYRRLGGRVSRGGLLISFGMLVLAAVQIWLHVH